MSNYIDRVSEVLPKPTAGALASSRTHERIMDACASGDLERLQLEVAHARAHYQSLEFLLNSEDALAEAVHRSFDPAAVQNPAPEPLTVDDAIRLTLRVVGTAGMMTAYNTAHSAGQVMAISGMDVQRALQVLYQQLDFSDPERELSDDELMNLSGQQDG